MNYICVKWKHAFSDEPILLYSEMDDNRWEVRKVEIFADGRVGYATAVESSGGSHLGEAPIPSVQEIANDPQFEPTVITKEEFDAVWRRTY
jgi:hypothetical protein